MKPIGTITKYFRFIDSETQRIIESIMESVYNYWEFVETLCQCASSVTSSDNLVFLAAVHAANVRHLEGLELLWANHSNCPLILPYLARVGVMVSGESSSYSFGQRDADRIFAMALDEWIAFQLYYEMNNYADVVDPCLPMASTASDLMDDLIQNNPNLECFRAEYLICKAMYQRQDGNLPRSIEYCESAYRFAVQYDDYLVAADALHDIDVRNFDIVKAREIQSKAKAIYEQLGHKSRIAEMANIQGIIHHICGELNSALECFLENIHLRERAGLKPSITAAGIAFIYSEMEQYEDALEWGQMALATLTTQPRSLPFAYAAVTRALIGLRRFGEALEYLEEGSKLAIRLGDEVGHLLEELNLGYVERFNGNPTDSILCFEKALQIAQGCGYQVWINWCLFGLAEAEVETYNREGISPTDDTSESYLSRLELMSREKGYLGILGLTLLLKAKLRIKQDRTDDAVHLIREVHGLAQQPGLRFLEDRIAQLNDILEL
jgi:tetratricopeptide (TPR) repeat protein